MSDNDWKCCRAASRGSWGTLHGMTDEFVKIGALLRIADATEAMAKNYADLFGQVRCLVERIAEERCENKHLRRSNAALRGCIKRAKGGRK